MRRKAWSGNAQPGDIARRDFVALSVTAGLAATAGPVGAAGLDVVETNVEIKTPDGIRDAVFKLPDLPDH